VNRTAGWLDLAEQVATTNAKGPRTGVRKAFLVITWIVLAGIATQVTLIGLGLFYRGTFAEAHMGFGWMFGHLATLLLVVGFFARLPRNLLIANILDVVFFAAIPFIAGARESHAIVAGLHPLVALSLFGLTLYLALRLPPLIRTGKVRDAMAPPPTSPAAPVVQGRIQNR
jgi:hypothetical protein